jgi:hypothetical protein
MRAGLERQPRPGPGSELDHGVALDQIEHDGRVLHQTADGGRLMRLVAQRNQLVAARAHDVEAPARRLSQHDQLDADLIVPGGVDLVDEALLHQRLQMAIDRGLGGGEFLGDRAERHRVAAMREMLENPQREIQRAGAPAWRTWRMRTPVAGATLRCHTSSAIHVFAVSHIKTMFLHLKRLQAVRQAPLLPTCRDLPRRGEQDRGWFRSQPGPFAANLLSD